MPINNLNLRGAISVYEKAVMTFMADYRSGALGRISLEIPESRQNMIEAGKPAKIEKYKATEESEV